MALEASSSEPHAAVRIRAVINSDVLIMVYSRFRGCAVFLAQNSGAVQGQDVGNHLFLSVLLALVVWTGEDLEAHDTVDIVAVEALNLPHGSHFGKARQESLKEQFYLHPGQG